MRFTLPKTLALSVFFLFIAFACQEEPIEEPIDEIDHDMIMATLLADEYLNSFGGRAESSEKSITVFKYMDGILKYNTNTDTISGYQEVFETSVTAYAEPGEYLFWFAGGGVADLEEIDFDTTSVNYLETLPEEINADQMWVIQVPTDIDPDVEYLKYDIVYQYQAQGVESEIIRLDPKIRLEGGNDEAGGGENSTTDGQ